MKYPIYLFLILSIGIQIGGIVSTNSGDTISLQKIRFIKTRNFSFDWRDFTCLLRWCGDHELLEKFRWNVNLNYFNKD